MKTDIENYIDAINSAEFIGDCVINKKYLDKEFVENEISENDNVRNVLIKFSNKDVLSESLNEVAANASRREGSLKKLMLAAKAAKKKNKKGKVTLVIGTIAAAIAVISFVVYSVDYMPEIQPKIEMAEVVESDILTPTLVLNSGEKIDLLSNADEVKIVAQNSINSNIKKEVKIEYNTLIVPSEFTYTITLSDGSKVTVNANSELVYPTKFIGDTREVFLKGEAYFDIVKGGKPFIVNNLDVKIKVYGTEFNVNTINENSVETILVSGSLGINCDSCEDEVLVKPNQRSLFNTQNHSNTVSDVNPEDYLGWMSGFFNFNEKKLDDVVREFEKWYGIDFKFENQENKEIVITGSFNKKTEFNQILKTIGKTVKLSFIKDKDVYVIE